METADNRLEALITIMDYSLNEQLVELFEEYDIPVALLTPGSGSAKSSIYEILGYGGPKKVISITPLTSRMAKDFMGQLCKRFNLSKPGTGIACTIRLSSITSTLAKILHQADENKEIGSEEMTVAPTEQYHLIVSIVNTGQFDQVMEAAKKAGATGGTLVHARGLGSKEAIKYLGITIQPEKDLVLILAPESKKLAIMESIKKEVGLTTPGMGICFSLPVSSAIGVESPVENFNEL